MSVIHLQSTFTRLLMLFISKKLFPLMVSGYFLKLFLEVFDSEEMVIVGANTMKSTIESYHPAVESIKRICFNENSVGCPRYFEVVSVYLYVVCDF